MFYTRVTIVRLIFYYYLFILFLRIRAFRTYLSYNYSIEKNIKDVYMHFS